MSGVLVVIICMLLHSRVLVVLKKVHLHEYQNHIVLCQNEETCEPHNCSEREIFIKGSKTVGASLPWSSTAQEIRHLVAEVTKVPSELLHITVWGRALTEEVVCNIESGAILHYTIKGLGGADAEQQGLWLFQRQVICHLPKAHG